MNNSNETISALYIHIPFCIKKCTYCNFNSINYEKKLVDAYICTITKEIDLIKYKQCFKTIYIGGGTPTSLNTNQLESLLTAVNKCVNRDTLVEYTIEANPGTLTQDKINILLENNINRISLGAQSFNNNCLKMLGRIHSAEETISTISLLKERGFKNINIDLIFGTPSQTYKDWERDLDMAISLEPDHISTYSLTYEDETPLKKLLLMEKIKAIDENDDLERYKLSINKLKNRGFEHYEISNFAKNGKYSKHNIVYWKNLGYIGIGAGAFSFTNGDRESNESNVEKYIDNCNSVSNKCTFREHLTPKDHAAETIIMGLRMRSGISNNRLLSQTGFGFDDIFDDKILRLREEGFINFSNGRLTLTEKGLYVADSVMVEFLN